MLHKPVVGITIGDLNGIGPEIVIQTFTDNRLLEICTPVIFASAKVINFFRKNAGEGNFNYQIIKDFSKLASNQVHVFNCWEEEILIHPGTMNETGGKYAARSLDVAVQCLKDGQIEGIVTAPIHKKNIQSIDFHYTGHTPYLQDKFGARDVLMLMVSENLKVGLVTEHVPIQDVAQHITMDAIVSKLQILKDSLVKDFGKEIPKIAVLGLNPHAGDSGLIGDEEQKTIIPAIEKAQKAGIHCFGPYSADGFFAHSQHLKFDAVLAMYHDQGLIPFKSLSTSFGVNFTAGLNVVRTSPDHGTAFDIAGKKIADESSFREAVFMCCDIIRNRLQFEEATRNPLKKSELSVEKS